MQDYLNVTRPDYTIYRSVYDNNQQNIPQFTPDKTDAIVYDYDYVQSGIVKDSIQMITDFGKFTEATYDFKDQTLNDQFELMRSEIDYDAKVELLLNDMQTFGNGFIQVVKEDDEVNVYTPAPEICYCDYDKLNPQKDAESTNIVITTKKKDKEYTLVFKYLPGEIQIYSYNFKGEKVNPYEAFEEVLESYDVRQREEEDETVYFIRIDATYSLLQIARLNKPSNQFYGYSAINNSVLSKLSTLNQMYNLGKKTLDLSANPKFQMSNSTSKMIEQAIGEQQSTNPIEYSRLPETFKEKPDGRRMVSVSRMMSDVVGFINKKLVFFKGGMSGEGENKYIVNDYKLDDLYTMIDRLEAGIRNDLNVSTALTNPEMTTGVKTGVAYERLMIKTINYVDNLRMTVNPVLQRAAITMLELENGRAIDILPEITYPSYVQEEMSMRETLTRRLNAGGNTN